MEVNLCSVDAGSDMFGVVLDWAVVGFRREISCLHQHLNFLSPAITMDALKAEVSAKRKALQEDSIAALRPSKYMRRGDIERLKEEAEARQNKESEEAAKREAEVKATARKPSQVSVFLHPTDAYPDS